MSEVELTQMTSKGQIVIPVDIRREINAIEGTTFAVFGTGDTIVLKKIQKPKKEDFEKSWAKLVQASAKKAKAKGIKEDDVTRIIHEKRGITYD